MAQQIPCPTCQTPIEIDPYDLLTGTSYVCPGCQSTIAVATERNQFDEKTQEALDRIKEERTKGGQAPSE